MSILSTLDNMVLFNTNHPPLGNKAGSPLTPAEWDARITAIYDAIQSIVSGANVTAYDAGRTYDQYSTDIYDQFASYDSRIWKAVYNGSPSTFLGQTPAEGVYWTQVTLAEMLPDVMKLADLSTSSGVVIKEASLLIPSADVLTLNTTPLTIVPAVSGYIIDPISATVEIDFNSAAYATSTNIQLIQDNGGNFTQIMGSLNALNATTSSIRKLGFDVSFLANETQLAANTALQVYTDAANPTGGDSDITVNVLYRLKSA